MTIRTQPARTRPTTSVPDPSLPSVLCIVVTHNGRTWFKDCLVALNTQTYPLLDVLVVDDASDDSHVDPTLKRIAKRHLKRRRWGYLRTPRPLGYGGAINWALSRVRSRADLLLFIHDDAALDPTAVQRMVWRMYQDDVTSIVGPKIVSWDDPDRLEEVGMAVDRFGYPYKGLEEHEIDLGQHDAATDVFYVTSTCMLIRHEVFKQLRGWDARMRAFTEDLDLCWRARVAGHSIRVEPAARVRHAIALARGQRRSPFTPARYFIRRNRLRTITKNASGLRLLTLIPTFVLLSLGEMLGFIVLRQPREIGNLARALGWNLLTLPQTLSERARAQKVRRVPDRRLRRLTIRQSTRVRFYVSHQAGRLEEAWGRRAELLSRRTTEARRLSRRFTGRLALVAALVLIGFVLGFRNILFGPPASVGELLPYPDSAAAMWRAFTSPWRSVGFGQPGPAPPAFALLGIFPIVSFGAAGFAQKLLLFVLGATAFAGAYSLIAELVDRPSRYVAGLVYALGAVGYAGIRQGALAAMVFGAMAPFVLMVMIRLIGWVRPPGWNRGRAIARVAMGAAISAAFVPGSLFVYLAAAVLLAATRTVLGRGSNPARGLLSCVIALVVAWALLLPWSGTWLQPGGALDLLWSDRTWSTFAAPFAEHGFISAILGQMPETPPLFGLALPLLGTIAVLVGDGQRRRMALALWAVIVGVAWLSAAISIGALRPIVASPTELGMLAAAAFAGLAGLAVGAFRLDLPRRGVGRHHALALGGLALSTFLVAAGLGPAFVQGGWDPGGDSGHADTEETEQITGLMASEAQAEGQFRALWVGDRWGSPSPSLPRPVGRHTITGARGELMTDLFESPAGPAESEVQAVIAAVEQGRTDRGGSLLGAFNVGYVVLERGPGAHRWLSQADLAVARDNPEERYMLLANREVLPRAGVFEELPTIISVVAERDPAVNRGIVSPPRENAERVGPARYLADLERGEGVVFLAESHDPRWQGDLDGLPLERVDAGWGNGFALPEGGGGEGVLSISYRRSVSETAALGVLALAWIVIVGAAFSRNPRDRRATI
ncbi:MAG: glycosyltransferase [Actinomycetota bacterium]|nr:glycosyltransferase [Actinomycetota bacterium]